MNTRSSITRSLGLTLACGIFALAASTEAKKPVKPPPEPEPTLTYTLIPFENSTPEPLNEQAHSLNNAGLVAGSYDVLCPGEQYSVSIPAAALAADGNGDDLLDPMQALPMPAGFVGGQAIGVNGGGLIVGHVHKPESDGWVTPGFEEGAVWDSPVQVPQTLGVIDTRLTETYVMDVNNEGEVIGGCTWGNTINWQRAFIIVPENGVTWFRDADGDGVNDLMLPIHPGPDPSYVPGSGSQPYGLALYLNGINDDGVVCGNISALDPDLADLQGGVVIIPDWNDPDGDGNAWFQADAEGNNALIQMLPPLASRDGPGASAINSSGEIVGISGDHAVLWRDVGGAYVVEDLGKIKERERTSAYAISDTGWVLGVARNLFRKPQIPLLWHDGNMYRLLDLISNPEGWEMLEFADVNDDGALVGHGQLNGVPTAFLAVPGVP